MSLRFALCLCLAAAAFGQDKAPTTQTIQDLAWLTGCWASPANPPAKTQRDENWSKPLGGTMLGTGRAVADGKTREYEFMRIHQEADGLYYTAKPSGQAEASFKLISLKGQEAIFENAQHDFPQRVIYRRNADGSLTARIEGTMNGKQRGIDFPFVRAQCE